MAMLDSSIVIISLPAIFRGIHLNPLLPANIGYLLWMLMGYLVVTAVLVVTFGRIGDIFGRVRMYNLGFAGFTVASIALSLTPFAGSSGAMWLILGRVVQGIGGALLMANSTAILTDAFPVEERGLAMVLIGITYGIQPYGGHTMGWTSPLVLFMLLGGIALLGVFAWVERRVDDPMFDLNLFRIRAFAAGNLAGLLAAIGRGGLQFMLIIWLQGIWLPLHGYSFERTPLWAGIYMLPITGGFLVAGPISGWLSDRYGARPFATGGMVLSAVTFGLLMWLPANFSFPTFGLLILLNGIGSGLFAAPNTTAIMNSVPANQRGAASGMRATFMNSGMVLSIGVFFSLMIAGLASTLPHTLGSGLVAQGVPADAANRIAHLPPVGSLFAAFLGYNPIRTLLGPHVLGSLSGSHAAYLTGKTYFPQLISQPFMHGLRIVFSAATVMSLIAAAASWMRGSKYVHEDEVGEFGAPAEDELTADAPPPEEWVPA